MVLCKLYRRCHSDCSAVYHRVYFAAGNRYCKRGGKPAAFSSEQCDYGHDGACVFARIWDNRTGDDHYGKTACRNTWNAYIFFVGFCNRSIEKLYYASDF